MNTGRQFVYVAMAFWFLSCFLYIFNVRTVAQTDHALLVALGGLIVGFYIEWRTT